jgi:uncharacterized repeat protein (TIGR01451 family)
VTKFWIVARSNAVNNWTNRVNVSCSENDTVVNASALVEVLPVKLAVDKIANLPVVGNNTLVNFTITVTNIGKVNATKLLIKDLLPKGFTFVNASAGFKNNGQDVNWTINKLDVGNMTEFWIVARSNAIGNWTNTVNVSCYENETVVDAYALVKVLEVNATLVKQADFEVVGNNTVVRFTIKLNQTSLVNATNIQVTDVLPNGFVFVNASKGYSRNGQTVTWNVGNLTSGQSLELWITARSNETGTWKNTVTASSSENATLADNHTTVKVAQVNATLDKTADVPEIGNNSLVNFTIAVNYTAIVNATDVVITDTLPAGLIFVNATEGYNQTGQQITWNVGTVTPGQTLTYWVVVRTSDVGNFTNKVKVSCSENSTILEKNATISVLAMNATLSKTASAQVVGNNTLVTFTIVVNNTAKVNATDVTYTDILPAGFTFVSSDSDIADKGTYAKLADGTETVTWKMDTLTPGQIVTLYVVAKSNALGNWTNIVNATCNENVTILSNNVSVNVVPVNLTVIKRSDKSTYELYDLVNYTIEVTNNANIDATDVVVSDMIDLTKFEVISSNVTYKVDGNNFIWNVSALKPGETFGIWVVVKALDSGNFTNEVIVTSKENKTSSNGSADIEVTPIVNLVINKTVDAAKIGLNDYATFTINVTNKGPSIATKVIVTDVVPEGLDIIAISHPDFDTVKNQLVIDSLGVNESVIFTIYFEAIETGVYLNVANATCMENSTYVEDSASIEVVVVNLTAYKSSVDIAGNNSLVNFTITVVNTGDLDATEINIIDILPEGFTFVNASCDHYVDGNVVSCYVARVNASSSVEVWVVARSGELGNKTNKVNVTCMESKETVSANTTVSIVPVNFTVVKTSDKPSYELYELVNYTIKVTNDAKVDATDVVVSDMIDLTKFEVISSNVTYKVDGNSFIWNVSALKPGETFSIWVVVKALDSGNFTNEVTVTSNENKTSSNGSADIEVTPIVNLDINKTVDAAKIGLNEYATFTINVTNKGPSIATKVRITDVVPSGLKVIKVNNTDFDAAKYELVIGSLGVNESVIFTIMVQGIEVGNYVNVANVTCMENSTYVEDNAGLEVVTVNLTVDKKADLSVVGNNSLVNFTIIVKNTGGLDATGLVVKDVLPEGFTFVNTAGNYSVDANVVSWNVSKVSSNGSVELWIVARTSEVGNKTNKVTASCRESNETASADATVSIVPVNLKISKTSEHIKVHPYDNVVFTITVTNDAKVDATNVTVTDVVPAGFEFVNSSEQGYDNATGVLSIPTIKAGESYTFTVTLKTLVIGGNLTNVVSVNSNENKTVVESNVTVSVYDSSIKVENTANDKFVYSGNQTSFTVKITNDGHIALTDIVVYEDIPKELIYDRFIGTNWTYDGDKFIYTGSLAVGDSIELTIVLNSTVSGTFYNIATVGTTETEDVSGEDSVIVYTPELTVREISNNPYAVVGQIVSFTVVVTNVGDCDLSGVYVLNNYPDELIYKNFTGSGWAKLSVALSREGYDLLGAVYTGTWTKDGNKLSYSGILKPKESANYTLYFQTTRTGTFVAEASAHSDLTSNAYSNNTTVVVEPKLVVEKVADKTSVNVSDFVTFTITVKNVGDCDLSGIFVQEITPKELKYVKFIGKGWTKVGDKFVYSGVLAPGEQAILKIIFQAISAGNVTNIVIAGSNMTSTVQANSTVKIVNETDEPPVDPNDTETHEHVESTKPVEMPATGNPIMMLLLVIVAIIPLRRRKH